MLGSGRREQALRWHFWGHFRGNGRVAAWGQTKPGCPQRTRLSRSPTVENPHEALQNRWRSSSTSARHNFGAQNLVETGGSSPCPEPPSWGCARGDALGAGGPAGDAQHRAPARTGAKPRCPSPPLPAPRCPRKCPRGVPEVSPPALTAPPPPAPRPRGHRGHRRAPSACGAPPRGVPSGRGQRWEEGTRWDLGSWGGRFGG